MSLLLQSEQCLTKKGQTTSYIQWCITPNPLPPQNETMMSMTKNYVTPRLVLSCDVHSGVRVLSMKLDQGFSLMVHKYQVELCSRLMWVEMPSQVDMTSRCKTKYEKVCVWWVCEAKDEGSWLWEAMMKALNGTTQRFPVWFWRLCCDCGRSQVYRTS